jgi:hypothetical protein
MMCSCRKSIELALASAKSRGRLAEIEQAEKLESFREGMREGAYELVARHLFRSGIYFASLDNGLERRPSANLVREALNKRLADTSAALREFFQANLPSIMRQSESIDPEELLRGILRHRAKAVGLLEGNGLREIEQAEKVLERLNKLNNYLASWKEGVREEAKVEVVEIADMHS